MTDSLYGSNFLIKYSIPYWNKISKRIILEVNKAKK